MDKLPDQAEQPIAHAGRELARLHGQIEEARATLSGLELNVARAQQRLSGDQAAQLVEANEQLVIAALQAQADADGAARALREVSRLAQLDALTQLPNRALLLDRLGHAIASARRHGSGFALLFIDLDGFKPINDTLGHAVGDQVLKRVARCLEASVRAQDTVSRHGGDEFLVLLAEVTRAADAALVAHKISATLATPDAVDERHLGVKASIGISLYPDDADDAETLIQRADAAMYTAKRDGLGSFSFHGPDAGHEPAAAAAVARGHPQLVSEEQERRQVQLQEANERLLLSALDARDLQVAAEQARRRQTEFVAMVAHELRNPLAPIRTAAALLGRVGLDEPLLLRAQGVIERQVSHLSRLIGDLLEVSRLSTGKLALEHQRIDMRRVVEEVLEVWRPAIDAREQRLNIELPEHELAVQGDPVRLVEIVGNLLANASKYTPDGGAISLSARMDGDAMVLAVSDSGIGIAPDVLPTVFEPFVRDARAVGFNAQGLGVGLTIVRELVQAHGGGIVASSAGNGLGSRFEVTLPLAGPRDSR